MVDFHSHILPGVDDGSKSVEESLALLKMLAQQGVKTVAATPHFLANHESAEEFVDRRRAAFDKLSKELTADLPGIKLGAEVKYYEGISRMEGLKTLRLNGTKLLLLEMPMTRWTEYTVRELIDISCMSDVVLVLAHIERYWKMQSPHVWYTLLENGILMQVNATFFLDFATRRKAFSLLKDQFIHLIGSDCHNLSDRAPRIGKAMELIKKKLGEDFTENMIDFANILLAESRIDKQQPI